MQEFFIKDNPASVPGESEEDAFKMSIVVDDEDAEAVMSLIAMPGLAIDYGLDGCLYAYLKTHRGQVEYSRPLHRELIDAPRGFEIVHQNGDCLDKQEYQKMVAHLTREAIVFLAKLNAVSEIQIMTELAQGNIKLLTQINELVKEALGAIWEEFNAKN